MRCQPAVDSSARARDADSQQKVVQMPAFTVRSPKGAKMAWGRLLPTADVGYPAANPAGQLSGGGIESLAGDGRPVADIYRYGTERGNPPRVR